jgi:hypothetical protein
MNVMLSYLKSYENMGSAWIFCASGCKCASQTINAHHSLRQSTVFLARLLPTENADCVIGVKVLRNTTSGKHKFKVRHGESVHIRYIAVALQMPAELASAYSHKMHHPSRTWLQHCVGCSWQKTHGCRQENDEWACVCRSTA